MKRLLYKADHIDYKKPTWYSRGPTIQESYHIPEWKSRVIILPEYVELRRKTHSVNE